MIPTQRCDGPADGVGSVRSVIILGHSERSKIVVDAQEHAFPRGDVDGVAHVWVFVGLAFDDAVPRTGHTV